MQNTNRGVLASILCVSWHDHCPVAPYFSPMQESVKEMYISAVRQTPHEMDADVQVCPQ